MPQKDTDINIEKISEEVENIYKEFSAKLIELEKEKQVALDEFEKKLEELQTNPKNS